MSHYVNHSIERPKPKYLATARRLAVRNSEDQTLSTGECDFIDNFFNDARFFAKLQRIWLFLCVMAVLG